MAEKPDDFSPNIAQPEINPQSTRVTLGISVRDTHDDLFFKSEVDMVIPDFHPEELKCL
tara:strand:+ start:2393 stop:2569 length:177 start_codon:yes stop_codon:yes gene_type:complete